MLLDVYKRQVAKLDALHPYVNDDDSGNDTNKGVFTDEEQ